MLCLCCNKETNNPKFCSRSCSAKITGKLFPKKKLARKCKHCDSIVKSYRHTLCEQHWIIYQDRKFKDRTLGEYKNRISVKGKHKSWANAHVRHFARRWYKDLISLPCSFCGYNKHVELAHIKPLSEFSDETLISEVNAKENIIQLCRNCHWEFDNLERKK